MADLLLGDIPLSQNAGPTADVAALCQLPREMRQVLASAESEDALLAAVAGLFDRHVRPLALCYLEWDEDGKLRAPRRLRPVAEDASTERHQKQLLAAARVAHRAGEAEVRCQAAPARTVVVVPLPSDSSVRAALGVIAPADQLASHVLLLTQTVAAHIARWRRAPGVAVDADTVAAATALLELTTQVTAAPDLPQACHRLVAELRDYLQCDRVAVGLCKTGDRRCKLVAVSGVARFDRRSTAVQDFEAAMDEAVLRQTVTRWPSTEDSERHALLAHKRLCAAEDQAAAASTPLRDDSGEVVGALILLGNSGAEMSAAVPFLTAAEESLANTLRVSRRLHGGRMIRFARLAAGAWCDWRGKLSLAAVLVVVLLMFLPWSYQLRCACQVEPVTRRFVAAPFEGRLAESLVKPGEIVREGDVLARMDGREVRWQHASLEADRSQAVKRRDAAQAKHSYADQQIAQLEIERLDLELQLLDYRAENLNIKSPIDGIVASGDLERAEGAPLKIGQTLFEIAPLQSMVVEIAVADEDVKHVTVSQALDVRLDAYPGETWHAEIETLHPRSELRDEDNVFIAEADVNNEHGKLRPGMKGRAKINVGRRRVGWILFHKPWEYATKKLNW